MGKDARSYFLRRPPRLPVIWRLNSDCLLSDTDMKCLSLSSKVGSAGATVDMKGAAGRAGPGAGRTGRGRDAISQAKEFLEVTKITGIILTKMDGTAKGGIAIAIQSELKVPVKYIGVGEGIDDLQKFDADAFVDAIFDTK